MNEYEIHYTVFVTRANQGVQNERVPLTGRLTLFAEDDADATSYSTWNADGLVDVDFLAPNESFSASNPNVISGVPPALGDNDVFWEAIITQITRDGIRLELA